MPPTLLLDLDDTLLDNPMESFLPRYIQALADHLARWVEPRKMAETLLKASGAMAHNQDPARTLEETFDAHFYPPLGICKEEVATAIAEFYREIYPSLREVTGFRPQAVALVEAALTKGWQIAIATNPLFPLAAIQQRLAWAELPVECYPFQVVTAFERFHFAKPNLAYYAEILAYLGWPTQTVAMLGNSMEDDLLPAAQLGIQGFWLSKPGQTLPDRLPPYSRAGCLCDAPAWLDELTVAQPALALSEPQALQAVLRSTPAALDTLLRQTPASTAGQPPQPGEWCFTEIICHLRDSDREVNLPRFERISTEENAFLPAVNADAWSAERDYCGEQPQLALAGFIQARLALLDILSRLDNAGWQKPARHAIFGPTNSLELAGFIATHDRTHIQQALGTLSA